MKTNNLNYKYINKTIKHYNQIFVTNKLDDPVYNITFKRKHTKNILGLSFECFQVKDLIYYYIPDYNPNIITRQQVNKITSIIIDTLFSSNLIKEHINYIINVKVEY